jgi:hypothetical protein
MNRESQKPSMYFARERCNVGPFWGDLDRELACPPTYHLFGSLCGNISTLIFSTMTSECSVSGDVKLQD